MATNFIELATTLNYLGAKWLSEKKNNFTPCTVGLNQCLSVLYLHNLYVLPSVFNSVHLTEWQGGLWVLG